jgi:carboxynorspermidine decarboxylase
MEQFDPRPFMDALNHGACPGRRISPPCWWTDGRLTRDLSALPTPCYVVDETLLERNLQILKEVADRAGCRILLAQKAFSMFAVYPLIGRYLAGTAASGLYEAKLGHTEMGGETHVFSAAYRDDEFDEILSVCDHIVFNSFAQWERYKGRALAAGRSCGIRLNPECSTQEHGIYDPCARFPASA